MSEHTESPDKLESLDPATGDVVGVHAVDDTASVDAAVARARASAGWWAGLGFDGRAEVLGQWRAVLTRRMAQLADVVHAETGKPHADAQLEIGLAIDHLAWIGSKAEKVLGRHRVSSGLLLANHSASVEYRPLGVVGVIGPWNYPVFTPMGSIAYALGAGNTVVFKPSELTPGVGVWLADSLREVVGDQHLLQTVIGWGETGAALCRADIDKLAFTGSTGTGKKVMATCAENLTPVVIEAGGKDALIVDEDADLEAAADAAAWGAFSNAGQTCIGVERVYVHEKVHEEFVALLSEKARGRARRRRRRRQARPDDDDRRSSRWCAATSTTPWRAADVPWSGARSRWTSASPSPSCSSTCPRTPSPSPRRPSAPPSWSTRWPAWTRPSSAPTPASTAWAVRCSPDAAAPRSRASCARA